jgi:FAD/FMN-containing dehydrogenase
MTDPKTELAGLVGEGNVRDDPETLASYSSDRSDAAAVKPGLLVRVQNADQVQRIVAWANRTGTPLVPVSSGPPHFHGGTVPGAPGAVIVDLSSMKRIASINRRNRAALVEPGVTYAELQPALAKEGLRLSPPLMPRSGKSVVTSLLEREPRLNCRFQWSSIDPLRCLEIIWGDGNRLWTGDAAMGAMDLEKQWAGNKWQLLPYGPAQTDFFRLMTAAQGSLGIATWASVRCEVLPSLHKLYFVPADKLEALFPFTYKILKFRYADELFLMNRAALAGVLGESPAEIEQLRDGLPPWTVVVGIAGRSELPEERVAFQEQDISEIARESGLELVAGLRGVDGERALDAILQPSREPCWKLGYKGGFRDIFFITTLEKTPEFIVAMESAAGKAGYPAEDIGAYLQPRHQGVNVHCEFCLPYAPDDVAEASRMQNFYSGASRALLEAGALFTRPYGIWADLAFGQDTMTTNVLKRVKSVFDPNGVMNPGKLCFH